MNPLHRVKITEIPEIKYRIRRFRDATGVEQQTTEPYTTYREVKVITGWARFGHYIIDAVIVWVLQALVGFIIGVVAGTTHTISSGDEKDLGFRLAISLVNLVVLFLYYTIFEVMYASTPAKMMLGRIVIDEYALRPEAGKIALRSLSRLVPFEAFSCLADRGWHDRWTKTFVVDKQEAETLWNLLNQVEREKTQRDADSYRAQQGPIA